MPEAADPKPEARKDPEARKKISSEAKAFIEKQKLLRMSEISLILDTYDDIFSDFDPRPFDQRTISDDFLFEIRRASKEKPSGVIELKFMMPERLRKPEQEVLIRKRIREYFRAHYERVSSDIGDTKKTGTMMVAAGIVISVLTAVFVIPMNNDSLLKHVALVLLEPAGWFTIWEGANKLFSGWKELKPDLDFYRKMLRCEVTFTSY
jgi:hypothetical protein